MDSRRSYCPNCRQETEHTVVTDGKEALWWCRCCGRVWLGRRDDRSPADEGRGT